MALLLLLAGCGRMSARSTLRIAHESDVLSLDPAASSEVVTSSVLSNIYDALVSFDKDMRIVPALASEWTAVDEETWLLKLRKGVRFHDGRGLTAADVKSSLDRVRNDPASGFRAQLATIKDVEIVDPSTLRLRTLWPDPLLLNRLAYILIVPASTAQPLAERPVGTGAYRFVRWDRGRILVADAFPDHWRGRPSVDRVEFLPIEEGQKGVRALKQGRVDVLRWVPENMVDELRAVPGVRVEGRAGLTTYFLWLNSQQGAGAARNPLADRRVRQAISLAIDRRELVRRLGGTSVPANQLVPKGVFGHVSDVPDLAFDPVQAKRRLKEAGYGRGFDTTLAHRSAESMRTTGEAVGGMLGDVGIRVRTEMPEWAEVVSGWRGARIPFFLAGWRFDDGDALSFLRDCLFTRDAGRGFGSFNPGFSSPELDRLIDENGRIFGESQRLTHYHAVMQRASDEMPVVPLYIRHSLYGVSKRVRWQPRLDENLLAFEMALEGN